MVVLALILGLVLGALVTWVVASRRLSVAENALAGTRAELDVERRSFDDKVVNAVRAASADAYQANSTAFLEIAESKLTGYVRPLKESLEKVDGQVRTLELARERAYGALGSQLSQLSERTATLATALRTPHVRGRWGEIQLKRVVELAGMLPYCDFDEQVSVSTDDGRLRPDLIVRLPGEKVVIVDAKVPLAAYLDACEATDDAERTRHLESHARQVREHMSKLSAKSYWQQFGDTPTTSSCSFPTRGSSARPGSRILRLSRQAFGPACTLPRRRHSSSCSSRSRTAGSRRASRRTLVRCSRWGASSTSASASWAGT